MPLANAIEAKRSQPHLEVRGVLHDGEVLPKQPKQQQKAPTHKPRAVHVSLKESQSGERLAVSGRRS